jgi:hypothetical protein
MGKRKSIQSMEDKESSCSSATMKLEEGCQLIILILARLEADEKKILLREQTLSEKGIASSLSVPPSLPSSLGQAHSLPSFPLRPPLPSQNSTSSSSSCTCSHRIHSSSTTSSCSLDLSILAPCGCSCSSCTLSSSLLSDLRQCLSALFYLEADSYKWYKDDSIPYFLKLGSRIDLLLQDQDLLNSSLSSSSSLCPSTSLLTHLITFSLIPSLKIEIEAVTRILLLFPTGSAGGIPEEFRKVDLEGSGGKWKIKDYDLDDDGFEIIEVVVPPKGRG